jgi:hypothetical protein
MQVLQLRHALHFAYGCQLFLLKRHESNFVQRNLLFSPQCNSFQQDSLINGFKVKLQNIFIFPGFSRLLFLFFYTFLFVDLFLELIYFLLLDIRFLHLKL